MDSFVATKDLSVRNHMEVQAICQKHIDNSISKTINIPNDYDINDYGDLMLEFGPQLKGMTVYRQGSRGNEPLSPVTVEQAIEYLENEQAIEGSAATDCPSGICELPVSVTE
jgi:ribonucleotide reductase alpha subunit